MSDDLQHYMERCGELSRELSGALVALAQERRDKETYRTAWNRAEELLAQERGKADAVRRSNAALVEALDAERARYHEADALRQIVARHHDDEQRKHRRTRQLSAAQLGVEVDSEAYDEAFDRAEEALRLKRPTP